jgi:superfamily I DNA/RNA helicase
MSDWHREWQAMFPTVNQEVIVQLGGIQHRADVLTGKTVIEFQHSPMSQEMFNERNTFYHDLGYKVIWLFDLTEECFEGKINQTENESELDFTWIYPRNTFNKYDIHNGQIELFLQLHDDAEKCLIKVRNVSIDGFSSFSAYKWYSKQEFLDYFHCTDGECPEPIRDDISANDEYISFKTKYKISLDNQQERAAETVEGAILVLAVPGSGKTTTLISRIGYMVNCKHIDGRSILALTYTKNAASDMKNRYTEKFGDNDSVQFRTINSLADEIVRRFGNYRQIIDNGTRSKIIKDIYKGFHPYEWATEGDVKAASTTISYIKNMMLDYKEFESLIIWDQKASDVYEKYCQQLEISQQIDYDDQLVLAYSILSTNASALESLQDKYKFISVDEAQDTSKIQYEIIKLLASKSHNIFMVGDEDQSIYRFRAAYPDALLNFKNEYSNPFILQLETNYRSTKEIVDVSSSFIAKNAKRYPKAMHDVRGSGVQPGQIAVSNREEQYVKILEIARNNKEQVAFLYRDNACAIPLLDLFNKNEIEYKIRKPEEIYFFNEHIVQDIKSFLKLAINDKDTKSFMQIYYKCGAYIKGNDAKGACNKVKYEGKTIYEALISWLTYGYRNDGDRAERFEYKIKTMADMRPADAITHIYNNGYNDYLSEKGFGSGHVEILTSLARVDENLQDFLNHLDRLEYQMKNLETKESNIVLSTVHSSKGLEYDNVYIMDVYDGMFPGIMMRGTEEDKMEHLQEERRLFYVAMTRAKNKLNFFFINNKKSSFLEELFPSRESTLQSIISASRGSDTIVENVRTQKVYTLNFLDNTRFNAFEVDVDTGEIATMCSNATICNSMNFKVWRVYQGLTGALGN